MLARYHLSKLPAASLRQGRTCIHNGRCVVGNPGSQADMGDPSFCGLDIVLMLVLRKTGIIEKSVDAIEDEPTWRLIGRTG
jgi:hypothetical protein